jgi:pseudaminic acid synthase
MVNAVREAEKAIGFIDYNLTEKQQKGRDFCRSLYVVKDIKIGEMITQENVRSVRPGFGLHPKYYNLVLGKTVRKELSIGDRLNLDYIEGFNESSI